MIEIEGVPKHWNAAKPWLAHVSITTPDIKRLAAFYEAVFDRKAKRSPRFANNPALDRISGLIGVDIHMAWIDVGNMQLEMVQYHNPPPQPDAATAGSAQGGYAYVCIEVCDSIATRNRWLSLGATDATDVPIPLPKGGVAIRDIDGNLIVLRNESDDCAQYSLSTLDDLNVVGRNAALGKKN